jgi:hypothetical protein
LLRRHLGVAVAEQEEERRHQGDDHRELTRGHVVDASSGSLNELLELSREIIGASNSAVAKLAREMVK